MKLTEHLVNWYQDISKYNIDYTQLVEHNQYFFLNMTFFLKIKETYDDDDVDCAFLS